MTQWLDKPLAEQYEAAEAYLQLLTNKSTARRLGAALRRAQYGTSRIQDIWLAARPAGDWVQVEQPFSPLLLVATPMGLWIASGFNEFCYAYTNELTGHAPRKLVYYDPWKVRQ